jgi:hypothetical protein
MACGEITATGEVSLLGVSCGSLSLAGARLDGGGGKAVEATRLVVAGDMGCAGVTAKGGIVLSGASIDGALIFSNAHLDGKEALSAVSLIVTGHMSCVELTAKGAIRLGDASVDGSLLLTNAHLDGCGEKALSAPGLKVKGSLSCDQGFRTDGPVNLGFADIGGVLSFTGARLDGKGEDALFASRLHVAGAMLCNGGFAAVGRVALTSARINGSLAFNNSQLENKDGGALDAEELSVTGKIYFIKMRVDGIISLADAKISQLSDDMESWPEHINLDGLVYESIADIGIDFRLDWLGRSSGYRPQPYEQLAASYRKLGSDRQARRVLLAKQRAGRRQRPHLLRGWGWLQDALVGYGYAPGRALALLAGAFAGGWLLFRSYQPPPLVDPSTHPVFNAALYTLDVLIPDGGLGDAADWAPHGIELWMASGLHILGWLLAITVIAAITRSISRN